MKNLFFTELFDTSLIFLDKKKIKKITNNNKLIDYICLDNTFKKLNYKDIENFSRCASTIFIISDSNLVCFGLEKIKEVSVLHT